MSRLPILGAAALLALAVVPTNAEAARGHKRPAKHGHHVSAHASHATGLGIALGIAGIALHSAWHANYVPRHRAGYLWVAGTYVGGVWYPGHWSPTAVRAGYVWAPGHWVGNDYVEGYWRATSRDGYVWIEGFYTERGEWVEGYWVTNREYHQMMSADAAHPTDDAYHHSLPR